MGYIGNVQVNGTTHKTASTLYGTCDTAADVGLKVVTCADFDQLLNGVEIRVKFDYSNSAVNPTMNVNGTGAKPIYKFGTTVPGVTPDSSWEAGSIIAFTYDGTNWVMSSSSSGSGSGHTIMDDTATELTQRNTLQVKGTGVSAFDDATNQRSVIESLAQPCFIGDKADWNALSAEEKAKYALVVIEDEVIVSPNIAFSIKDQTLTFVNDVATVTDSRLTSSIYTLIYYSDASIEYAKDADITVSVGTGVVTFTATNTPEGTITCDIVCFDLSGNGSGGGGAGGGHIIEDAAGNELPQEAVLQFGGYLRATDDSTNGKTVVTDAPEEVTWSVWQTMTTEQKQGHHWLITDAPTGADSVRYFAISASNWEENAGTDATEFPYIYNLATTAYGADFVPAEVLLLGSSSGDYPSAAEEADIVLVDKYIKFTATGVRLRATDELTNNLTLVIRDGSSGGASGGGMAARLMITSTVIPTITSPSGSSLTPVATSTANRYYCDTIEYGQHTVTQTTGGASATININVRECKLYDVADKTTFEGIQQILNAHMESDLLSVGDEISEIALTGNELMVWVIGAINHEQQHQVIFVPKWCLSSTRQMNSTNTNVGGWNSSALRAWLNGDFYSNLPASVKPYVKDRTFQTSQGNTSTSLQSATDKIWLPREWEIFGATTYAAGTEHTAGDAEQFPIFATTASRIKTAGKAGAACPWWEVSPYVSDATAFCFVNTSGAAYCSYASYTYGVAPCFHMLADN